jgi:prephenate dehydratase
MDTNMIFDPLNVAGDCNIFSLGTSRRKSSVAMALRNIPGAIFKMSSCFAFRNIDIIKIESRPATIAMKLDLPPETRPFTQRHWDLIFYIDYEPSDDPEVNAALFRNLEEYCLWYKIFGSYKCGLNYINALPSEWTQMVDTIIC